MKKEKVGEKKRGKTVESKVCESENESTMRKEHRSKKKKKKIESGKSRHTCEMAIYKAIINKGNKI